MGMKDLLRIKDEVEDEKNGSGSDGRRRSIEGYE